MQTVCALCWFLGFHIILAFILKVFQNVVVTSPVVNAKVPGLLLMPFSIYSAFAIYPCQEFCRLVHLYVARFDACFIPYSAGFLSVSPRSLSPSIVIPHSSIYLYGNDIMSELASGDFNQSDDIWNRHICCNFVFAAGGPQLPVIDDASRWPCLHLHTLHTFLLHFPFRPIVVITVMFFLSSNISAFFTMSSFWYLNSACFCMLITDFRSLSWEFVLHLILNSCNSIDPECKPESIHSDTTLFNIPVW